MKSFSHDPSLCTSFLGVVRVLLEDFKMSLIIVLTNVRNPKGLHGSVEINPTGIYEDVGSIPGLTQWLRIWHCHELWCRSQTGLGFCAAVAVG